MLGALRCGVRGLQRSIPAVSQQGVRAQTQQATLETAAIEEKQVVNPFESADFFGVKDLFTMHDLFDAKVHLGHKVGVRNPYMVPYLFGNRLGVDIIDLDQTTELLREALNFTAHIAYRKGIIMFLSRNRQLMPLIERTATDSGEYAHCRYWRGGTFTNSQTLFQAVTRLPDLCVFVGAHNTVMGDHIAITECAKMNIPTVAILDSSCDPRFITYPVPGNDDTPSAVQLYCDLFKKAILRGKERRSEIEGEAA